MPLINKLKTVGELVATMAITGAGGAVLDYWQTKQNYNDIDWSNINHVAVGGALSGVLLFMRGRQLLKQEPPK